MNYLKLWRPQQWSKNLFLLAGVIFAQQFMVPEQLGRALLALVVFCLASGGIYAVNDVWDRAADRCHPRKRYRPVAAGKVTVAAALCWGGGSLLAALVLSLLLHWQFTLTVVAYEVLMLMYTAKLKDMVITDVLIIAVGFVLRAYAGAVAVGVEFSHWLLLATFLLALLLALGKRKAEYVATVDCENYRPVLREYSLPLLERLISVATSASLIVYALYTVADETIERFGTDQLKYTVVFVIFGLFRYLFLLDKGRTATPEQLVFEDPPLLINLLLWVIAVGGIIYFR